MSEPADLAAALGPDTHVNVGIDLEDVARFDDPGTNNEVLFTADELAHAASAGGAAGASATRLAGTWCAKEAAVKALWPWTRLDPRRVHVTRTPDGRPTATVTGHDLAADGVALQLSISHTSTFATAVAVAWGPTPRTVFDEEEQQP
jgi:phosphopantetheine--protein transferase-like protein